MQLASILQSVILGGFQYLKKTGLGCLPVLLISAIMVFRDNAESLLKNTK